MTTLSKAGHDTPDNARGRAMIAVFFAANVLVGAGLYFHAFLYNFYIESAGHAESVMGVAAAAISAGGLLALIPAGRIVDRFGTATAYVFAALLASAGLAAGAVVTDRYAIYAAAVCAGAGAGAWRVTMAPALLRLAPASFRERAFSWNTALLVGSGSLWTAGAGASATFLQSTLSTDRAGGLRAALLLGALATASAALIAAPMLRRTARTGRVTSPDGSRGNEQQRGTAVRTSRAMSVATGNAGGDAPTHTAARRGAEATARSRGKPAFSTFAVPRNIALLILGIGVVWTAGALALPFYNVWFDRAFGLSIERIGLILGIGQAITAVAVFASGEGAARLGPRRMLIGWLLLFPPALCGLALAPDVSVATTFYMLQAFVLPAIYPLVDQIVLERAPADHHGAVSGWRNVATEGSGLIGAAAGGYLLAAGNFVGLFLGAAGIALVAGLATIRLLAAGSETVR